MQPNATYPAPAATICGFALALFAAIAPAAHAAVVTSTWASPASGTWNVDANWTNTPAQGGFPGNGNGGVATYEADILAVGGAAYTVTLNTNVTVERLVINSANATLSQTSGTLTATNGISLGSGTLNINGGTISNTVFTATGGTVSFGSSNNSTLDTVSGLDVLRFITASSRTKITGGTTFNTARLAGNGSGVGFAPGQTLNGTILFEGAAGGSRLVGMNGSAGTLAIGSSGVIRSTTGFGGSGVIGSTVLYGGAMTLSNAGLISSQISSRSINITTSSVSNSGTIQAIDGGTLAITSPTWTNTGILKAANGGTLSLGGTVTRAALGTFDSNGGTITFGGTMDNSGDSLNLTAVTGSFTLTGGTIRNGTVLGSGGAGLFTVGPASTSTLDGVNVQANVTLVQSSTLRILNGVTLGNNATITIASAGVQTTLRFGSGVQSLSGTGEVILGGSTSANYLWAQGDGTLAGAATATLGPGITLHGPQSGMIQSVNSFDSITNRGTINADTAGQTIAIRGNFANTGTVLASAGTITLSDNWTNAGGTLRAFNGGTIDLQGTFTRAALGTFDSNGGAIKLSGILDNTGAVLSLTPTTGSLTFFGGTLKGGLVTESGGAGIQPLGFGTLDGVTLGANVLISTGSLTVRNGLTMNNVAVTLGGPLATFGILQFTGNGAQTLGGTGEVRFAGAGGTSFNILTADSQGLQGNSTLLTIGAGITIHGTWDGKISAVGASDSILNQGSIIADTNGRTINIVGNFTQAGTLETKNGGSFSISGGYTQTAGVTRLNGGSLTLGASSAIAIQGGMLEGNGTVNGKVNNSGIISPGLSAGALTIAGDLTFSPSSELRFEIGGSVQGVGYDFLSEDGALPLDPAGILAVRVTGGFDPAGFTFTILTSNINFGSGTFANVAPGGRLPTSDGSGSFRVDYGPASPSVVLSNFTVPEPGVAALWITALPVVLAYRRRRILRYVAGCLH